MLAEVKVGSLAVISDSSNPNKTQGKSHEMNQKMNRNEHDQKMRNFSHVRDGGHVCVDLVLLFGID